MKILIDKMGSSVSPLGPGREVRIAQEGRNVQVGDVVAVRAISESVTYGNLELPSGRLAKINAGDSILGVLGKRRALKGFVGDVPKAVKAGDRLHLLNMGGVIGECTGHHSSLSDAIAVEVVGVVVDDLGFSRNIAEGAGKPCEDLDLSAPLVVIAGACMNSGKTVAAIEIIKQASRAGYRVAGAKLSGIACLRDTLNMEDHGAFRTSSFLDFGLPSTVDRVGLASTAKGILNGLNSYSPDLIVAELGDGIIGGYGVESILSDPDFQRGITAMVFCASDYVGVVGGIELLRREGIEIDVIAGSVTDSEMGERFVTERFAVNAGNARRDGKALFELVRRSFLTERSIA